MNSTYLFYKKISNFYLRLGYWNWFHWPWVERECQNPNCRNQNHDSRENTQFSFLLSKIRYAIVTSIQPDLHNFPWKRSSSYGRKKTWLISRKMLVSTWKEISSRTVCTMCTLWKMQKFSLTLFSQKFRESNGFTKEIAK